MTAELHWDEESQKFVLCIEGEPTTVEQISRGVLDAVFF